MTKAPVVVVTITPDTQCTGINVTVNIDASYVPLGTLDTWSIAWGDGATSSGGPGAWPPGPGNQNHAYANAGTYTIRLTVTDTLGVSGTATYTVEIVSCTDDSVLIEQMYALSQTAGPYIRDMTAVVPAWVQRARGLTGGYLSGRDLKLDPHRKHLRYGIRHVWIATQAGPAKSAVDMLFWARLYPKLPEPNNDAGDFPAPTKASLGWYCISFNPMVRDTVFVLAGTATRGWVYYSLDSGKSWNNWAVRW